MLVAVVYNCLTFVPVYTILPLFCPCLYNIVHYFWPCLHIVCKWVVYSIQGWYQDVADGLQDSASPSWTMMRWMNFSDPSLLSTVTRVMANVFVSSLIPCGHTVKNCSTTRLVKTNLALSHHASLLFGRTPETAKQYSHYYYYYYYYYKYWLLNSIKLYRN